MKNSNHLFDNPTNAQVRRISWVPWGSAGPGWCEWPPQTVASGRPPFPVFWA